MNETEINQEVSRSSFKKGMTLNEYIHEMKDEDADQKQPQEDLYETSRRIRQITSKKLIPYEIREIDEDEYEEENSLSSANESNSHVGKLPFVQEKKLRKNVLIEFQNSENKNQFTNSRGFRVRRKSNSPFNHLKKQKQSSVAPSSNFTRTLQNSQWKIQRNKPIGTVSPSSTFYGQFSKQIKTRSIQKHLLDSKQKLFKKKNTKDIQYLLKYEKNKSLKYSKFKFTSQQQFCVEGITDRLVQRRYNPHKHQNGRSKK